MNQKGMIMKDEMKPAPRSLVEAAQKALDALIELKNETTRQLDREMVEQLIDENFVTVIELLDVKVCECGYVARAGEMKTCGGVCSVCFGRTEGEPTYEPQFSGKI